MKFLFKSILTLGILIGLNVIYQFYLFDVDVARYADQYHQVMKVKDADVLYLSASSNFGASDGSEAFPKKISELLGDALPETVRVEAINKPASHLGVFCGYLALLPEDAEAETLVVTVNLRSFGPDWVHSELETALNQAAIFYNQRPPILNRLLLSLKAYDDSSIEERQAQRKAAWDHDPLPFDAPQNIVTSWCAVEKWGDWRNPKRQLADQFIKQYGFVLKENNERVKDLRRLITMASERQKTLILHILPENIQTAEYLVGDDLSGLMRKNALWLMNTFSGKHVQWVNNLELLDDTHFRDRDFPTEHYDAEGRRRIAERIRAEAF